MPACYSIRIVFPKLTQKNLTVSIFQRIHKFQSLLYQKYAKKKLSSSTTIIISQRLNNISLKTYFNVIFSFIPNSLQQKNFFLRSLALQMKIATESNILGFQFIILISFLILPLKFPQYNELSPRLTAKFISTYR